MPGQVRKWKIVDFSGGESRYPPDRIASNEAVEVQMWQHIEGNLRSYPGVHESAFKRPAVESTSLYVCSEYRDSNFHVIKVGRWLYANCDASFTTDEDWLRIADLGVSTATKASFAPWGNYLYIAAGTHPLRYEGMPIWGVTNRTAGGLGTAIVEGQSSCRWMYFGVRPGDSMWFYTQNRSTPIWTGPYHVKYVLSETQLRVTPTIGTFSGQFSVARIHNMGIDPPTASLTLTATAGTSIGTAGTYQYIYTFKNSYTGYESNAIGTAVSVRTTATCPMVQITGLPVMPSDWQVNRINIYRTHPNGDVFHFCTAIARGGIDYTFTGTHRDTTPNTSLGDLVETDHDHPPMDLEKIRTYNSRIWGIKNDNVLYFSSINNAEYWPMNNFGLSGGTAISDTAGGYIELVGENEKIMDIMPEGGAFGITGKSGGSLLIFTRHSGIYRLIGWGWSDFSLIEGILTSCVSKWVADKWNGYIFWVSDDGPVMMEPGSQAIIPIYLKVFPQLTRPFYKQVTYATMTEEYLSGIVATVWRDWYIMAWPEIPSVRNNRLLWFHIPTRTFSTLDHPSVSVNVDSLCVAKSRVWNNWLTYGGPTAGRRIVVSDPYGSMTAWQVLGAAQGVPHKWKSGLFTGDPPDTRVDKRISRIWLCFDRPTVSQDVNVTVYTNGRGTGTTYTVHVSATAPDSRVWKAVTPTATGWGVQLQVSGTFTRYLTLNEIEVEYYNVAEINR